MKHIAIVFSKHTGFNIFSTLIRWGLKTPFSHVAIKMTDGDTNQIVYYQASGLSVNCISEPQFLSTEVVIFQKDVIVSEKTFVAGKTFAINQLGKPYSLMAIFGFALQVVLSWIGIKIKNPFAVDGDEFVCSQFAAAYIEACDNINLDVANMTPKALYDLIPTLPDVWN